MANQVETDDSTGVNVNVDPIFCPRDPDIMQPLIEHFGTCTLMEVDMGTDRTRNRKLGSTSCGICDAPAHMCMSCELIFSRRERRHLRTTSRRDLDLRFLFRLIWSMLYRALRPARDIHKYAKKNGLIVRPISEYCKQNIVEEIPKACMINFAITHSPSVSFKAPEVVYLQLFNTQTDEILEEFHASDEYSITACKECSIRAITKGVPDYVKFFHHEYGKESTSTDEIGLAKDGGMNPRYDTTPPYYLLGHPDDSDFGHTAEILAEPGLSHVLNVTPYVGLDKSTSKPGIGMTITLHINDEM